MSCEKTLHLIDDDPRGSLLISLRSVTKQAEWEFVPHTGRQAIGDCLQAVEQLDYDSEQLSQHFFLIDIAMPLSAEAALGWQLEPDERGLNGLRLLEALLQKKIGRHQLSLISNLDDIGQNEAKQFEVSFFSKYDVNLFDVSTWLQNGEEESNRHE